MTSTTLLDKSKTTRERLDLYFDHVLDNLLGPDFSSGCLVGNLCAEVANQSDILRVRLASILEEMRADMLVFLREGVASGELPPTLNIAKTCGFICSALQGSILVAKVLRSAGPINNCRRHILVDVLKLSSDESNSDQIEPSDRIFR